MLVAQLDANGWAIIIGAVGIIVVNVVTQVLNYLQRQLVAKEVITVKDTLQDTTKKTVGALNNVTQLLVENTATTEAIASTTAELEKQGNSRWDKIKGELVAAKQEIKDLQQMRIDDASNSLRDK